MRKIVVHSFLSAIFLATTLFASEDEPRSLLVSAATEVVASDNARAALAAEVGGITLPLAPKEGTLPGGERFYWDIPFSGTLAADSLLLELTCDFPRGALCDRISLHFRAGDGWYAFPLPIFAAEETLKVRIPLASLTRENNPAPIEKISAMRVSAWFAENADLSAAADFVSAQIYSLRSLSTAIAIVSSTDRTAPGAADFARSLAERTSQLLDRAGIDAAIIADDPAQFAPFKLVFLPYSPTISAPDIRALIDYIKAGGKLVVFYNATAPLAAALGFDAPEYRKLSAQMTAIAPDTFLFEMPPETSIPHVTANIIPAWPAEGNKDAKVVAKWKNSLGREVVTPAASVSSRGAWFAHIPPLPYPSAADFFRGIAGMLLSTNFPAAAARELPPLELPPKSESIRAVWMTGCEPRTKGGWQALAKLYAEAGLNTIFMHLPDSQRQNDYIPASLDDFTLPASYVSARTHCTLKGIELHLWTPCWTLDNSMGGTAMNVPEKEKFLTPSGERIDWLCIDHAANRARVITKVKRAAKKGAAGIHFDYLRYPSELPCVCAETRKAFEKWRGKSVENWPQDVLEAGKLEEEFIKFRAEKLTQWLREVTSAARRESGKMSAFKFSAAVFPDPNMARKLGQDWKTWLDEGLINFVTPMIYRGKVSAFRAIAADNSALCAPEKIVAGIGSGADESQLDAVQIREQINAARLLGLGGFAFFCDDDELRRILPTVMSK